MSTERYIQQGMLAELQQKLAALEDRAEGVLQSIRIGTMPAPLGSVFDLDAVKLHNYTREFLEVATQANQARAEIDKLKDALGVRE